MPLLEYASSRFFVPLLNGSFCHSLMKKRLLCITTAAMFNVLLLSYYNIGKVAKITISSLHRAVLPRQP
jgi:hypothetical protein